MRDGPQQPVTAQTGPGLPGRPMVYSHKTEMLPSQFMTVTVTIQYTLKDHCVIVIDMPA